MTRDEMIEIATKVWGKCDWHESALCHLEAFAKLAAMRTLEGTYDEMIDIVRKNEREACAKVCGRLADEALVVGDEDAVICFEEAENAIRARGEA